MNHFNFDGNWSKEYNFDAFKGLQSRRGSYTSMSSNKVSNGTVSLTINDDTCDSPDPYKEQLAAINYLIENPTLIRKTMREGVASIYESLKIRYDYQEEDEDSQMSFPKINNLSEYDRVFGVGNVYVQLPSKDGFAYIGIECGCTWDDEHGLGFLLHKNRLVSIGSADEAFNWDGYKDNGTLKKVLEDLKSKIEPIKFQAHAKYGQLKPSQQSANDAYEATLIRKGYNSRFISELESGAIELNGKYETIDSSYLELAISSKNIEIVNHLLENGAEIRYSFHNTKKDLTLIDLLVDYDGDINTQDNAGNTILYQASVELVTLYDHRNQNIKSGSVREEELSLKIDDLKIYMEELVNKGADTSIENSYGYNCLNASRNLPIDQKNEINRFFKKIVRNNNKGIDQPIVKDKIIIESEASQTVNRKRTIEILDEIQIHKESIPKSDEQELLKTKWWQFWRNKSKNS